MNTQKHQMLLICVLSTFTYLNAIAQLPNEVASLVGIGLEEGEIKLEELGYEIAHSSLFGKSQLWYNEEKNVCIELHFKKKNNHAIESIEPGDLQKCKEGVIASREVWEKYHDGPAPAKGAKIEAAREKLKGKGFKVSYWIDEIAPGRISEYWWNEATQKCKFIVWDKGTESNLSTSGCEAKYGKNPAPK